MTDVAQIVKRAVELYPNLRASELAIALLLVKQGLAPIADPMLEAQALALYLASSGIGARNHYEGVASQSDQALFHGIAEMLRDAADQFERAGK